MKPIKLSRKEVKYLKEFCKKGRKSARALTRAKILLLAHKGRKEIEISETLDICRRTISHIKKRYREEGLESALVEKPRSGQPPKYTQKHKVEIIATTCSSSPKGSKRWTIQLLTNTLRKKKGFKTINRESVRLILKKANLSLG